MKLWKTTLFTLPLLSLTIAAQADTLGGIYASVDYWSIQGDYQDKRALDETLDIKRQGRAQFALSVEHPIPLLPNVRLRHVNIDVDSKQQSLGQATYQVALDNTDFIAYYELLDNIISADVGFAAKRLSGDVSYAPTQHQLDISETLPMLYGSVGAKLPFTGLSAKAEALLTKYSNKQVSDVSAEIKYDFIDNILLDVGGKVGYRLLNIDLDKQQGDIDSKFRFDGPYLGLEAHF